MEEPQRQELENLVQGLEEEYGVEESLSPEVEALLQDLEPTRRYRHRRRAARQLGEVSKSNRQIMQALVTAAETDASVEVRAAAVESLGAPVHQAVLQRHPELGKRAQSAAQRAQSTARRRVAAQRVTRPAHFQVEAQGSTLSLSWKDGALHRVLSAGLTLLLLLMFGCLLFASTFSGVHMFFLVLLLMSGYWVLVAFVNSTQITASREEWTFQRGPFPFPNRRFYSFGKTRIDPAAYREIRTDSVEEKRRGGYGGGSSSDIGEAIAEVFVGALLEQSRESHITYTLCARAKDGTDKLLLTGLEDHEAAYLTHTLQNLLDAGGGSQPGE